MTLYPTTGRADDLLAALARAEAARAGRTPPGPLEAAGEAAGYAFGRLAAAAWSLLPAAPWLALHDRVFRRVSGLPAAGWEAAAGGEAERRAGLLCLFSHPGREEGEGINVELARSALLALRALRGRPCRPRLMAAVDPFALDGLRWWRRGPYAGYLAGLHIGLDRLRRSGRCAWPSAVWRLLRALREGGEVAMVLSGGMPATARALYTAREALWELRRCRPGRRPPSEVHAALGAPPSGALFRSAWRRLEHRVISELCADLEGLESGVLSPSGRAAFAAAARALGWPGADAERAASAFAADFARRTPPRARLFRVLAARLRGAPVLLLPLTHAGPAGPGLGPPVRLPRRERAEAFARDFVSARYF